MAKIKQITAREILNSKGNPTVEVAVFLNDGVVSRASCPMGTSTGSFEAAFILDNDEKHFGGLGVLNAVEKIEKQIAPKLLGIEADKQQEIDKILIELDGTQNKGRLGVNAILPVSMACAKAAAKSAVLPLFLYLREFIKKENSPLKIPIPLFNLINGGKHAQGGNLDFQEFLLIPASSKQYSESLEIGVTIYKALQENLEAKGLSTLVGDEGGFSPSVRTNADAFSFLTQAIDSTNIRKEFDVFFGLDAASTSFYKDKKYKIKDIPQNMSPQDLYSYYETLTKDFHLLYIEDPYAEDDWDGWGNFGPKLAQTCIIAGDDLIATNPYRLQMALNKKAVTGIVIKPNQIGTVIETLAVVEIARQAGIKIIVSHRSAETNDNFIADLAVAVSADYVKLGAPVRGERVAKYNRLLQIEQQIKAL